jgi:hypothetical protein
VEYLPFNKVSGGFNMDYADGKFGVIERKWFGLTKKMGGDCASGYTFGTTDATSQNQVARWYPKGPIVFKKFGSMVLATIGGGGTGMDVIPARLRIEGVNESGASNIPTAGAPYSIASTVTFTKKALDAGSYVDIITGTPQTGDGTAANTATSSGTVAFFIDYARRYDATKWNV